MSARAFGCRMLMAALPLLLSSGCKTWEPATTTPIRLVTDERPPEVRIVDPDGRRITVKNPIFINDSIVSATAPPANARVVPPRVGVSTNDIQGIEVSSMSRRRTVLLIGAIAAASVGWATIASGGGGGSDQGPGPLPKQDPAMNLIGVFRLLWGSF